MGDPAGIGPEVCLRLLADLGTREKCVPIVFGDAALLRRVADHCGLAFPNRILDQNGWAKLNGAIDEPAILDLACLAGVEVTPGHVDRATGMASYRFIEAAIRAALANEVDAVSTGPIHKGALHSAGVPYPGHTEIFAARTEASRVCMMLTCAEITCSFVTTHVGYTDVPGLLSVERILDVVELSHDALSRLHGRAPRLVACGLNPHAGEHGLFGSREEEELITPALEVAREKGINISGPLPPDTAFLPARRREADCFLCMYHDQGHIPLKALAFDVAVNVTLGLPIIRTSVDHGTALDIAWQNKADVTSIIQAVDLARRLAAVSG